MDVELGDSATSADSATDGGLGAAGAGDDAAGGGDGRGVRLLRPAQAGVIVSALERVRARVPVADLEVAEEQLVKLAAHLSPGELRTAGKEICDLLDSDGPEPDEQKASARESLTLTNADNGLKFRGYLANENAELLRALIHAGARPHKTVDGELDPRAREKRQADALTTGLTIAAAATDAGHKLTNPPASQQDTTPTAPATAGSAGGGNPWVPGFGAKANITVTIDFNDLRAATADATGDLVYGDGLSAATIRRLACDAKIIPLVLGSNSEPLDVGRAVRLVTGAMRRALNARDRGCVVCGAPPVQCDAHHLVHWIDRGTTAIWNLALLCRRHHVDLHAGHWHITITNGVVHVARPTWADPPPRPEPPGSASPHPARAVVASSGDTRSVAAAHGPSDGGVQAAAGEAVGGEESCAAGKRARSGRWSADAATLQEAARFAVWGETSASQAPATSRDSSSVIARQSTRPDP
jgi:5-methylcytosine-specific restriction protein A